MNDQPTSLPTRIRELRTQRRLSQDRLAAAIGVSKSSVQNFESGKLIPQEGTAQRIDEIFGTGSEIQGLAKVAHEDLRPWLRPWVEHERRAVLLRAWEPTLIPGLLQTEEYMRLVFSTVPSNIGRLDEVVATRRNRQATVLDRRPPVELVVMVEESTLRRGPAEILKAQLGHLVDLSHRPTVRIRAVPDAAGIHAGLGGPLSLATMPDGRRVGYLDDLLQGRVATTPGDVLELELVWEAVNELALTADQTRDMMLRIINEK